MGTGVMIGAGIFALTGQIAELAGPLFPLSFIVGALVTSLAAYSYIKMSNRWPSSGGIAMILQKAYGPGVVAASASLLMALSMVINESLVARTFATYALRPFGLESSGILVSVAALALIVFAATIAYGIRARGMGGYLATFAEPSWVMIPLNVIEQITRTFSLIVRLFGNVMSGVFVVSIVLSLAGLLVPIPLMALDLLTGAVQAYIFAVLATVFIGAAVGETRDPAANDRKDPSDD